MPAPCDALRRSRDITRAADIGQRWRRRHALISRRGWPMPRYRLRYGFPKRGLCRLMRADFHARMARRDMTLDTLGHKRHIFDARTRGRQRAPNAARRPHDRHSRDRLAWL